MIKITDEIYPYLLKQIHNPPQKLYYRGDLNILKKTCISIVGTRRNSDYGEFVTKEIIRKLAILDIAIVSGLAKGIDTIAHKTALDLGLPTIAVLGSGIDNIYPSENHNLAQQIEQHGLILSEYPGAKEPLNFQFPQRNRIISGLSIAVVVIEAPEKSGALITARLALEQGREIFTVPGDIDREKSRGPLRLLQNGAAYPVASGEEIIEVLSKQPHLFQNINRRVYSPVQNLSLGSSSPQSTLPQSQVPSSHRPTTTQTQAQTSIATPSSPHSIKPPLQYKLSPQQTQILELIPKFRPVSLETLVQKTALKVPILLASLSILEIKGLIKTKDEKFQRGC